MAARMPCNKWRNTMATSICSSRMSSCRRCVGDILAKALTARYPNLLVIYMSGYTDNALIESDSLPENMVFLQKPFPPDVMLRLIREVLDKADGHESDKRRAI